MKNRLIKTVPSAESFETLEYKREINKQIEEKENEARATKEWLRDHPDASLDEKSEMRRRLFAALQDINDLVCKLKPCEPYTIR